MSIQIYITCLSAEQTGHQHGCHVDAALSISDIYDQIYTMLNNSPAQYARHWKIQSIKSINGFDSLTAGKNNVLSIDYWHQVAVFIKEKGDLAASLLVYFNGNLKQARTALKNYVGEFRHRNDYIHKMCAKNPHFNHDLETEADYELAWYELERCNHFSVKSQKQFLTYIFKYP